MTKIEWCDETVNPIVGCSHASIGCENCFAEAVAPSLARRMHGIAIRTEERGGDPGPALATADAYDSVLTEDGRWNGKTAVVESGMERLRKLAGPRVKPRRVFVGSMTDLFHESVDRGMLGSVFCYCAAAEQHTFLWLTKRPERIAEYITDLRRLWWDYGLQKGDRRWPNIWLGVTAENQEQFDRRVTAICDPSSPSYWPGRKFVSVEPVFGGLPDAHFWLGELGEDWMGIEWVLHGCESGPRRRPAELGWFRSLRDQCVSAGVPYFLKQGSWCPACDGGCGGRSCEVCEAEKLRKMPMLDGRQWAEIPEGMPT